MRTTGDLLDTVSLSVEYDVETAEHNTLSAEYGALSGGHGVLNAGHNALSGGHGVGCARLQSVVKES